MKVKYIFAVIITVVSVFVAVHVSKTEADANRINCIARMVYVQGGVIQHLTLGFNFNKQTHSGVVNVEGILFPGWGNELNINRDIYFDFMQDANSYTLISDEVHIIKGESPGRDVLEQTLPEFYSAANKKINYTISREENSGYLFSNAGMPLFFCECS
ncbi:putative membrane protein [Trabulsiella guamensis ATCC 49490]|uniref:Putative membrane protein n=1 Tax=Trabulsiella guamensis ATCC 49490 TaxID=1005994 RepID=A0A084ZLG7_9ENTR|nr:hypothetical protein [Trabulsiella guamensis]KFB98311.1 putative membrane protein [Trabulsiella guamensis ATCC 49490]